MNLTYRKIDIMEVMLECLNGQDCKITKKLTMLSTNKKCRLI